MLKKIIKIIIILLLTNLMMISSMKNNNKVLASTNTQMYFVFDKTSYNTNDVLNLTINLDKFSNLNEIKLQIKLNKDVFEPILTNEKYFYFSSASIFITDIINDYVDDSYLRLRLIKNDEIDSGYFSSYKNNICHLKLKVLKPIDNVEQYFMVDNYENYGISAYLFNTFDEIINFDISYKEKIKINWEKENYELNVFSNVPDFKEDIEILNRKNTEYEYLIEKTIDTNIIGIKTIHIGIYDATTADYIILSKPVLVVDKIKPTIISPNSIEITDQIIYSKDYLEEFVITDNYDEYLDKKIIFYDENLKELANRDSFDTYLKNHQLSYLKLIVKDNSLNESYTELIEVKVKDTVAPTVNIINEVIINDYEVDDFNLESLFIIEDDYDNNPIVILDFFEYNDLSFDEIKEKLKKGQNIKFKYFVKDKDDNKTEEIMSKIIVIDTTKPTILVEDFVIDDVNYIDNMFKEKIKIIDNFNEQCTLEIKYYIDNELLNEEEFNQKIKKGYYGNIEYIAIDNAGNRSEMVCQNVSINDTIFPTIIIENIKDGEKYVKFDKINYLVFDNFDFLEVIVTLDNEPYNNEKIEIGKHTFKVIAKDLKGNETIEEISFQIIEDNIIGCGDDASCYINNYLEIVIIVGALLLFVLIIIITSIIIKRRKK